MVSLKLQRQFMMRFLTVSAMTACSITAPNICCITGQPVQAYAQTAAERDGAPLEAKDALKEKAVNQYRTIIETYPGSRAAAVAAERLRALGVDVPHLHNRTGGDDVRFDVAQQAALEVATALPTARSEVACPTTVAFQVINRGNGSDSFTLTSGFPAEFSPFFTTAANPATPITQTPLLKPGESFSGQLTVTIPAATVDGTTIARTISATSLLSPEARQDSEIRLIAAAPRLTATLTPDTGRHLPGEQVSYRIVLANNGTASANGVSCRLTYPPHLQPVEMTTGGFRFDGPGLLRDGLSIPANGQLELGATFRIAVDTPAGQELVASAELVNQPLATRALFTAGGVQVMARHGLTARLAQPSITAIPGQAVTVPLTLSNTGNLRESFTITASQKSTRQVTLFHDLNRDGVRQPAEPAITETIPLAPHEEISLLAEIQTSPAATDSSTGSVQFAFRAHGQDAVLDNTASLSIAYSRPVLQISMARHDGSLKPGETAPIDLTIVNSGSDSARNVLLASILPAQMELIAADPAGSVSATGMTWSVKELPAGARQTVRLFVRVKRGTGAGSNLKISNSLVYEDRLGGRY